MFSTLLLFRQVSRSTCLARNLEGGATASPSQKNPNSSHPSTLSTSISPILTWTTAPCAPRPVDIYLRQPLTPLRARRRYVPPPPRPIYRRIKHNRNASHTGHINRKKMRATMDHFHPSSKEGTNRTSHHMVDADLYKILHVVYFAESSTSLLVPKYPRVPSPPHPSVSPPPKGLIQGRKGQPW